MVLPSTMPLSDWLKSWIASQPPEKSENVVVAESLLMELDYQMRDAEELVRQKKEEERLKTAGVDYSWLSMNKEKPYEMSQLERLELEELCMKIKPDECSRVILMFREALVREPQVQEIPRIMKAVIFQVQDGRPKEETMPEWVMRSITSLSKFRPTSRVSPLGNGREASSSQITVSSTSLASTPSRDEKKSIVLCIDELPV